MGGLKLGKPDGILPTVATWPARFVSDTKATEMTTRNSATGRLGRNFSPNHRRARQAKTDAYDDWMRLEQLAGDRNHAPDKVDESNPNHSSQLTCPLFRHPLFRPYRHPSRLTCPCFGHRPCFGHLSSLFRTCPSFVRPAFVRACTGKMNWKVPPVVHLISRYVRKPKRHTKRSNAPDRHIKAACRLQISEASTMESSR